MKYCKNCNTYYESSHSHCLLCHNELASVDEKSVSNFAPYIRKKNKYTFFTKSFSLVNIISMIISMFIDYSVNKVLSWSLIVSVGNLYLILFLLTIIRKTRFSYKVINILIISTLEIIAIGFLTDDYHWALDIVFPFILIVNTLFLTIMLIVKRKEWQDYIFLLFGAILFDLLSILLNILKVSNITWAITSSFIFGLITLIALLIFSPKDLKEEFSRRFHV